MQAKNTIFNFELPPELKGTNFPTFQEFCRDPDKYRGGLSIDSICEQLEGGGQALKKILRKVKFRFGKFTHATIDKCLLHMRDEGYSMNDVDMKPQIVQAGTGKADVIFHFMPKCPKGAE